MGKGAEPRPRAAGDGEVRARIEQVLEEQVRPMLRGHGGDVRLADWAQGVVYLELQGACAGCPSADLDTKQAMERILRAALPQVRRVELEQAASPELLEFARELLRGG